MKNGMTHIMAALILIIGLTAGEASASDVQYSTPGLSGYDPVAYFTEGKPMRGSGYHVTEYEGITYTFTGEEHRKQFTANPKKFLPAYGGYCAYGAAVGKKFVADPEVWKVVDGTLYLNLDEGIQSKWEKDIPGFIKKANANWTDIQDKAPGAL
ncbi:MAG: YHS domain protein [Nitrospira sp.]|nr:YHS domain protein [Nitrospira sp.]